MEPDVIRRREGIQLSYTLPHRITATCLYPRNPSNGSTIIVCAHSEGLRLIWYAGKKPKPNTPAQANGNSLDLTDDENDNTIPDYEDEEAEIDPSRPFRNILHYTDVSFGTAAIKIAVPPFSPDQGDDYPQITNTHAIILAACADLSLRLVAVPLEPATESRKPAQQIIINGTNSHQDLVSDVAITITAAPLEEDSPQQRRTRSRSRGRESAEVKSSTNLSQEWSFLLASASPTGTGLLVVHQIPIGGDGWLSDSAEDHIPVQRRFLRCSLAKARIEFSPSVYPSHRHSVLLIASCDGAATKIYQAIPSLNPAKKRRGSTATTDSALSANLSARRNASSEKVLIDLHVPFSQATDRDLTPRRKRILDAKWVLHGRAILVLLEDGEWGVWDLEAAGPSTTAPTPNLVQGQGSISGMQGGSVTKFAISGLVSPSNKPRQSTTNGGKLASNTSLAPMTPHTRKVRSEDLFKGLDQGSSDGGTAAGNSMHGILSVLIQTSGNSGNRTNDESVILSYGSTSVFISSLQSYWRAEGSRGSFDGATSARPILLPQLQTVNEEQRSMHIMPQNSMQSVNNTFLTGKLAQDFLVATSSRLILFVAPLTESVQLSQTSSLPMRLLAESTHQDQMLLDSGELDVDGMDRILNGMAQNGAPRDASAPLPSNNFGSKSVGFQLEDDDQDVDMTTPTASTGTRSKLVINKNSSTRQDEGRRLFT